MYFFPRSTERPRYIPVVVIGPMTSNSHREHGRENGPIQWRYKGLKYHPNFRRSGHALWIVSAFSRIFSENDMKQYKIKHREEWDFQRELRDKMQNITRGTVVYRFSHLYVFFRRRMRRMWQMQIDDNLRPSSNVIFMTGSVVLFLDTYIPKYSII